MELALEQETLLHWRRDMETEGGELAVETSDRHGYAPDLPDAGAAAATGIRTPHSYWHTHTTRRP